MKYKDIEVTSIDLDCKINVKQEEKTVLNLSDICNLDEESDLSIKVKVCIHLAKEINGCNSVNISLQEFLQLQ